MSVLQAIQDRFGVSEFEARRYAYMVLLRNSGNAFTPARLFAAGEQGYWLDPSDFSTMFQDEAGTTPVTAVGQNVGLILDKSRGALASLGPELVTLDFTGATGTPNVYNWRTGGTATVLTANSFSKSSAAGIILVGLNANKYYEVSFSCSLTVSDSLELRDGLTGADPLRVSVGTGTTFSGIYKVLITSGNLYFRFVSATTTVTFTNISVREVPGNHFIQSNVANRPVLGREPFGGRRNLLTWTEGFDNAAWVKERSTISADAAVAPNGTSTADKIVEDTSVANTHNVRQQISPNLTSGVPYSFSFYAKANGRDWVWFGGNSTIGLGGVVYFDVANGLVGTVSSPFTNAAIQDVGNGWYRCSVSGTPTASATANFFVGSALSDGNRTYTGDGTSGIFIWGAQLETGSTATAYQRVGSAFDVTEAGVPDAYYLAFDGTDDWLQSSATINPGAVDAISMFAGVRKISDTARGTVIEHTASVAANNGGFQLTAPNAAAGATYAFESKGTALTDAIASGFAAPITNVITGLADISDDSNIIRVNGVQADSDTGDQGTGNFANALHYIGRRGGASQPFNGRVYQAIARFAATDAGTVQQVEQFIADKTGVTL